MKHTQNFSWLKTDGPKLAGLAFPRSEQVIRELEQENVALLISLTAEASLPSTWFNEKIKNLRIPVADFDIPKVEQVDLFILEAEKVHLKGNGVAVHCMGGIGRTGTFLACWLVRKLGLDADAAVLRVRKERPHSLETADQVDFVRRYAASKSCNT